MEQYYKLQSIMFDKRHYTLEQAEKYLMFRKLKPLKKVRHYTRKGQNYFKYLINDEVNHDYRLKKCGAVIEIEAYDFEDL